MPSSGFMTPIIAGGGCVGLGRWAWAGVSLVVASPGIFRPPPTTFAAVLCKSRHRRMPSWAFWALLGLLLLATLAPAIARKMTALGDGSAPWRVVCVAGIYGRGSTGDRAGTP